jgi:hypothetical protein
MAVKIYYYLVSFFFLSLLIENGKCEENNSLLDEYAEKIISDMGIDKNGIISREQFTTLFRKILFREDNLSEEDAGLFENLIKIMSEEIPEIFAYSRLEYFLNMDKIMSIMKDLMEKEREKTFSEEEKITMKRIKIEDL